MTNLSTSEVLGKLAPEFLILDEADRKNRESINQHGAAECIFCEGLGIRDFEDYDVRTVIDTVAQTLLKLERAKEALRSLYLKHAITCRANVGEGRCKCSANDQNEIISATLAYIEEGKE